MQRHCAPYFRTHYGRIWTISDAKQLTADKVEIPAIHMARYGEGVNQNKTFKDTFGWCSSSIAQILKKREYLGHTVNFKTRKHFKDKKSSYVDESEWRIFENNHEPIIDQDTFDNVQRIRGGVRHYPDGWGDAHPLTGLMYCAYCGGKMYVHRINNGKRVAHYTCAEDMTRGVYVPVGSLPLREPQIAANLPRTATL